MPASKVTFKETVLELELENVEVTVGPEIMRVGHLHAKLDVADLLRVQIPELTRGNVDGILIRDHGEKKIQVIKELRALTGLGLKEAKDLSESLPKVLTASEFGGTSAEQAVENLRASGANVEIHHTKARVPTVLDRLREILAEHLSKEAK